MTSIPTAIVGDCLLVGNLQVCRGSRSKRVSSTGLGGNRAGQPLDLGTRDRARCYATGDVLRGLDRIVGLEIIGWIPLILVDLDFVTLGCVGLSASPRIPFHANRGEIAPRPCGK